MKFIILNTSKQSLNTDNVVSTGICWLTSSKFSAGVCVCWKIWWITDCPKYEHVLMIKRITEMYRNITFQSAFKWCFEISKHWLKCWLYVVNLRVSTSVIMLYVSIISYIVDTCVKTWNSQKKKKMNDERSNMQFTFISLFERTHFNTFKESQYTTFSAGQRRLYRGQS